ncbi:MAG TPA: hypothetical protein VK528_04140, partial [Flavobacterium sp.]|nr:hypothetical protein [Flavobacterium sp.]
LSLEREVRLKNAYIIKGEKVIKDSDGNITEIHATYDTDSLSGSGTEASQRKVSGTLHWVSIPHAIEAEVRLYDRLFTDEAPDSHKEKDFLEFVNPDSLKVVTGFVEPSLAAVKNEDKFQFQRLGYFTVDKDSTAEKLVFNKTVGLKDAWEEKGKKEQNLLITTQKEINKLVKEKDILIANEISTGIVNNIKSINNYSLLLETVIKNVKNDNNSLLFSNLILSSSDRVEENDFDIDLIKKLYTMSLKSQMASVRYLALKNLKKDSTNCFVFKPQLDELRQIEKDQRILDELPDEY